MRVLVTGGAGFIGSHLVRSILAAGDQVVIYDNYDPQVHVRKPKAPSGKGLRTVVAHVRDL
jgi:nucleoside-diphosphate-sugar epimerase